MDDTFISTVPISRETYKPYGDLIACDEGLPYTQANMGTAKRFNKVAEVTNLRPENAQLNLCLFRCSAMKQFPFEIRLLEKHQHSTQVFLPVSNNARFLVIVCLGEDQPDLTTLKSFEARAGQGISYKPGVWHYPMTALDKQVDFACLVFEDGTDGDCVIFNLDAPIEVDLPL